MRYFRWIKKIPQKYWLFPIYVNLVVLFIWYWSPLESSHLHAFCSLFLLLSGALKSQPHTLLEGPFHLHKNIMWIQWNDGTHLQGCGQICSDSHHFWKHFLSSFQGGSTNSGAKFGNPGLGSLFCGKWKRNWSKEATTLQVVPEYLLSFISWVVKASFPGVFFKL